MGSCQNMPSWNFFLIWRTPVSFYPQNVLYFGEVFAAQNPLINQANASAAEPEKAEGKHVCSFWGSRFLGILGTKGNPHFWAPFSAELAPARVKSGQSCRATSGRCSRAMLLNQRKKWENMSKGCKQEKISHSKLEWSHVGFYSQGALFTGTELCRSGVNLTLKKKMIFAFSLVCNGWWSLPCANSPFSVQGEVVRDLIRRDRRWALAQSSRKPWVVVPACKLISLVSLKHPSDSETWVLQLLSYSKVTYEH